MTSPPPSNHLPWPLYRHATHRSPHPHHNILQDLYLRYHTLSYYWWYTLLHYTIPILTTVANCRLRNLTILLIFFSYRCHIWPQGFLLQMRRLNMPNPCHCYSVIQSFITSYPFFLRISTPERKATSSYTFLKPFVMFFSRLRPCCFHIFNIYWSYSHDTVAISHIPCFTISLSCSPPYFNVYSTLFPLIHA